MSKYSGHGGYAVFVQDPDGTPEYFVIHNINYQADYELKLPEYTDSESGGYAQGLGRVTTAGVNLEVNDDSESALDIAGGLAIGDQGDLYVRRGELEYFDIVTTTNFKGLSRTNDNMEGGVPRVRVGFQFGSVQTWVAKGSIPSALRSYLEGLGLLVP